MKTLRYTIITSGVKILVNNYSNNTDCIYQHMRIVKFNVEIYVLIGMNTVIDNAINMVNGASIGKNSVIT